MPEPTPLNTNPEWIEVRDANGRLLFFYSPLRETVRIRRDGLTTDVDLPRYRATWWERAVALLTGRGPSS